MEHMRRVAYETVLRACGFGSLAIFCVMIGFSFELRLAFQTGGTLTMLMTLILIFKAYEARTKAELPVLVRWFEGVQPPVANWLVAILYSREQLAKEGETIDADWGIVGCLYTMEPEEIPMAPITMMRNALGVAEGGSGVPLDREACRRSVAFWECNANWRP